MIDKNYTSQEEKLFWRANNVDPVIEPVQEALRYDQNKTNWSLMPFEAVEEISKVLEFGAKKYAAWNFTKNGGMQHSRIINSCLRHIFAYMRGEDVDPESGLSHLAHAGCNILFLLYYKRYPQIFTKDDRNIQTVEPSATKV
jgi:capsule polysaccharide export protein KpsC/LpsZ